MTAGTLITNYLLLHLGREFPGLDVWPAAVVKARTPRGYVQAGEIGQADITGVWGGRCAFCGHLTVDGCAGLVDHDFSFPGRSVWIEVKSPGDRQKPRQKDFERRVSRLGALYILCAVKKRATVREIAALMGSERRPKAPAVPAVHPVEISNFLEQLRARL